MNFKSWLKKQDDNQLIAIGTENGNGWVAIVKAGETDLIARVFEDYRKSVIEKRRSSWDHLVDLTTKSVVIEGLNEKEANEIVLKRASEIKATLAAKQNADTYIKKYVDPFVRHIKIDYRKSIDEGIAVIITGSEVGKYWLVEEFDKDYRK